MKTIVEPENIDAVIINEFENLIVYIKGREKPFVVDTEDENYNKYFKAFNEMA